MNDIKLNTPDTPLVSTISFSIDNVKKMDKQRYIEVGGIIVNLRKAVKGKKQKHVDIQRRFKGRWPFRKCTWIELTFHHHEKPVYDIQITDDIGNNITCYPVLTMIEVDKQLIGLYDSYIEKSKWDIDKDGNLKERI